MDFFLPLYALSYTVDALLLLWIGANCVLLLLVEQVSHVITVDLLKRKVGLPLILLVCISSMNCLQSKQCCYKLSMMYS